MPYSRTSTGYPAEMRVAVERAVEMFKELVVDCEDERAAKNLRGKYYQYLAACKRDSEKPPSHWTPFELEKHRDFLRNFLTVEFYLKGQYLHIRPRDLSPTADMLSRAKFLDEEAHGVPPAEQSGKLSKDEAGLLDRLLTIQEKK